MSDHPTIDEEGDAAYTADVIRMVCAWFARVKDTGPAKRSLVSPATLGIFTLGVFKCGVTSKPHAVSKAPPLKAALKSLYVS